MFCRTLSVTPDSRGFRILENFILEGAFSGCSREKLLIVMSELFENIVEHTGAIKRNRLVFRFFTRSSLWVLISYSAGFGFYIGRFDGNRVYFKDNAGRLGGIGTSLIKNLVHRIFYLFLFCQRFVFVIV